MEAAPNVSSSEKQFIEFLVSFIVKTNPGDLLTNLGQVADHLQKEYDAKHDLNLYRKAFGNIKDVCKQEGVKRVFVLEGTAFKFVHPNKVAEANAQGVLTEAAWATF